MIRSLFEFQDIHMFILLMYLLGIRICYVGCIVYCILYSVWGTDEVTLDSTDGEWAP